MANDLTKLPLWARTLITDLQSRIEHLTSANAQLITQIAEYEARQGPATIILEPYRGLSDKGTGRPQLFPITDTVRVNMNDGHRRGIEVHARRDGWIDISCDDRIQIMSEAANHILVRQEPREG